jgi:hypothetical protein
MATAVDDMDPRETVTGVWKPLAIGILVMAVAIRETSIIRNIGIMSLLCSIDDGTLTMQRPSILLVDGVGDDYFCWFDCCSVWFCLFLY